MRILHQFFIIIFVISSLILVKDDVRVLYDRTVNFLSDKMLVLNNEDSIQSELDKKTLTVPEISIETPGALKIPDNLNIISREDLSRTEVINITNEYRYKNGLGNLTENSQLDLSASKKLEDMFNRQYFEHLSPDNVGVGGLSDEVGYEYITIGENLAMGKFSNNESLVKAWMDSPGHRANILNKNYTEIGVAVGKGIYEGKEIWMAVQHFALPKSFCPEVDKVLLGTIEVKQNQADELEQDLAVRRKMIDDRVVYGGLTTNEQIDIYNVFINDYNNLISDLKNKIEEYNTQVRLFNLCISEYTAQGAED